MPIRGQYLC